MVCSDLARKTRLALAASLAGTGLALAAGAAGAQPLDLPDLIPPWDAPAPSLIPGIPGAAPFILGALGPARDRAVDCLTSAVYYEAATEPRQGQEAVAQVVLNRVNHPAFPKTVCGVVYQGAERTNLGCQFTFTCDGSLGRQPVAWRWAEARDVAEAALAGHVAAEIGGSTHYHAAWVSPYWRSSLVETRRIGAHVFYRMPGAAAALTGRYAGNEPAIPRPALAPGPAGTAAHTAGARHAGPPAAADGSFSVWGLQVARVSARRGKVVILDAS